MREPSGATAGARFVGMARGNLARGSRPGVGDPQMPIAADGIRQRDHGLPVVGPPIEQRHVAGPGNAVRTCLTAARIRAARGRSR